MNSTKHETMLMACSIRGHVKDLSLNKGIVNYEQVLNNTDAFSKFAQTEICYRVASVNYRQYCLCIEENIVNVIQMLLDSNCKFPESIFVDDLDHKHQDSTYWFMRTVRALSNLAYFTTIYEHLNIV